MINQWVTYMLLNPLTHGVLYVGACELRNVFKLPDWNGNADQEIMLSIVEIFHTSVEAKNRQYELVKIYDLSKTMAGTKYRFIRCVETGEIFKTISMCAKAHNLGASNLINHLNGRAGFKSVKGKHYVRI